MKKYTVMILKVLLLWLAFMLFVVGGTLGVKGSIAHVEWLEEAYYRKLEEKCATQDISELNLLGM